MLGLLNKIKVDTCKLEKAEERLIAAWNHEDSDRPPLIVDAPPPAEWPRFPYSEAFYDVRKMLINELASVYTHALLCDDAMLTIRANYGVGIIPSAFGCKIVLRGDNMPWAKPLLKEAEEVYALKLPDFREEGLTSRVLATIEFYKDALSRAGLSDIVHIYLADTQGPLDIAFILRGVAFYRDLISRPKEAHRLLEIATQAYIEFSKLQKELIGEPYGEGYHSLIRMRPGGVRICEDVAVNLSPRMYLEFSKPYNEKAFEPFEGGFIHFCGDGNHIMKYVVETRGIRGLNLGDPQCYKLPKLMELLSKKKICLIGWPLQVDKSIGFKASVLKVLKEIESPRGIIFRIQASSIEEGRLIIRKWEALFKT